LTTGIRPTDTGPTAIGLTGIEPTGIWPTGIGPTGIGPTGIGQMGIGPKGHFGHLYFNTVLTKCLLAKRFSDKIHRTLILASLGINFDNVI
jgi:hypothetical protein